MAEINKPLGLNRVWAENGVIVPPSDAKYRDGWRVEAPPYQFENFINNKHDSFIAHTNQHGLPQWDIETEYQAGKSWTLGANGSLYFCKVTHTGQNPVTDLSETYWRKILDGNSVLPASSVSPFALTLLDDTSAAAMRQTLGGTTIGQNLFTTPSAAMARTTLGGTVLGSDLFTSTTQGAALSTLGVSPISQYFLTLPSEVAWRNALGANNASNLNTGKVPTARLPVGGEGTVGISQQASQPQVDTGTTGNLYVTPQKLRFGFAYSLSPSNGYIKFPSWLMGFIIQWGRITASAQTTTTWTYPLAFPNAVLCQQATLGQSVNNSDDGFISIYGSNTQWCTIGSAMGYNSVVNCFAIGY